MTRIFLSPPETGELERQLVLEALDSNWIAPVGPALDRFETEIANRCGTVHAVGLTSGTAALHLALLGLGVMPGDEVVVSTLTFAATANAVRYCGATPVFVDADADTWQMSPTLLAQALDRRRRAGARVAAVIAVDLYGRCAPYDDILPILDEAGIPLIEDAAEALGARWHGEPAGSFGAAGVVSFNGNKIITASGGGMLVTDDHALATNARYLSTQARQPVRHYEHVDLGFNYRLSNILAALGSAQLATLDERIDGRRQVFDRYVAGLADVPGLVPVPNLPGSEPNYWLSAVLLPPDRPGVRDAIIDRLEADDIESRPLWKPLHLQPFYRNDPAIVDGTSQKLFDRGLCLPSGGRLAPADQDRIISIARDALAS